MYLFLGNKGTFFAIIGLGVIMRICEDDVSRHDMVLQQCLEVLLTHRAEQECIDFSRQLGKGLVGRRKDSTTDLEG